jgi:6-pyruvoyltetrahydropterin/6-carboxytetrahydropterin synthase
MAIVRVTKEFRFEMAHALWNYDGPCRNIHGHSYKLLVTVKGEPLNDPGKPKHGMIIDFGDLKKIVKSIIINRFDHTVVVNKQAPYEMLQKMGQMFEKYEVMDFQPTCEKLVIYFADKIKEKLPESAQLQRLRLYETTTSFAEWYEEDNK